jgi:hypothetical protein
MKVLLSRFFYLKIFLQPHSTEAGVFGVTPQEHPHWGLNLGGLAGNSQRQPSGLWSILNYYQD